MASLSANELLVRSLPLRLQKFFALYPPRPYTFRTATQTTATQTLQDGSTRTIYNPFQPHKNPDTGRWHPPIYSLRRQAELVKTAAAYGVEELLPFSKKKTQERAMHRIEHGLRVKGTGIGQRVKGHKDERVMFSKLIGRRRAMAKMPNLVYRWKMVSLFLCLLAFNNSSNNLCICVLTFNSPKRLVMGTDGGISPGNNLYASLHLAKAATGLAILRRYSPIDIVQYSHRSESIA